jgi:hypothetical protein
MILAAALALAVSGCVTRESESGPQVIRPGGSFTWFYYSSPKRFCQVGIPAEYKIITPPQHGRLEIVTERGRDDNEGRACSGKDIKTTGIAYRAPANYAGPDRFVVEVGRQRYTNASIRAWRRYEYQIIVK